MPDHADVEDQLSPPLRYQDAMDEALVAVEQVVIPRQQPIELLPQTPELLDMQVNPSCSLQMQLLFCLLLESWYVA